MTAGAIALVVAAALIHATWNLLAKRAASAGAAFVLAYSGIAAILYAPAALWLIATGGVPWSLAAVGFVLLSGMIHLGYTLTLQRGYREADLSVVYPVARGTGPMLSTFGAILILGEPATLMGLTGMALVVTGIGLIATQGDLPVFRRPGGMTGVRWGMTTGGFIAAYTVVDAISVKRIGIAPLILDWFTTVLRALILLPMALARPAQMRAAMRGHWLTAAGVGALSPLSYIFVLSALQGGAPLSVVAPMREMSMMAGAILGMIVLREPVGAGRLIGCAILTAGVVLLAQT